MEEEPKCECGGHFVKHGSNYVCNRCKASIDEREFDRESQALK